MGGLNFQELISAFIVLFAVIDIIGAVPIILDLKQKRAGGECLAGDVDCYGVARGVLFRRRHDAEVVSGGYRFVCSGGRVRDFPDVARNDIGYRNL